MFRRVRDRFRQMQEEAKHREAEQRAMREARRVLDEALTQERLMGIVSTGLLPQSEREKRLHKEPARAAEETILTTISRITDDEFLRKQAAEGKTDSRKCVAVLWLRTTEENKAFLIDLSKNKDSDPRVRKAAIEKVEKMIPILEHEAAVREAIRRHPSSNG